MLITDGVKGKKMGMFDDITVPKSYLKGLLTKEQEKLIKGNSYQTKSLENFLGQYKIHRQKLYVKQGEWKDGKDGKWVKDPYDGTINFYTSFSDDDGNRWWVEFDFLFRQGVLDQKHLVDFKQEASAAEVLKSQEEQAKRNAEADAFRRTFKYKFYEKVRVLLSSLLEWVQNQTRMPSPNNIKIDRHRVIKKRKKASFWKDF